MSETITKSVFELKNASYDRLKWVVQIFLPAAGALYAALGLLWGFPAVEAVVGTSAALALFGGSLLGISAKSFNGRMDDVSQQTEQSFDGNLVLDETDPDKDTYMLAVTIPIKEIRNRNNINLKVLGSEEYHALAESQD